METAIETVLFWVAAIGLLVWILLAAGRPSGQGSVGQTAQNRHAGLTGAKHLYLMQVGTTGPVKIGIAVDVEKRRRQVQTGNPEPVRIVASLPHASDMEKVLHRRFARYRMQGEWFQPAPEIFAWFGHGSTRTTSSSPWPQRPSAPPSAHAARPRPAVRQSPPPSAAPTKAQPQRTRPPGPATSTEGQARTPRFEPPPRAGRMYPSTPASSPEDPTPTPSEEPKPRVGRMQPSTSNAHTPSPPEPSPPSFWAIPIPPGHIAHELRDGQSNGPTAPKP